MAPPLSGKAAPDGAALLAGRRLRLERTGQTATLHLSCPERRNAIDLLLADELDEATALCAAIGVGVIVVRGDREAFCVGGDIDEFAVQADRIEAHVLDITDRFHRSILRLAEGPAIVIGIVEGVAAGAGLALAAACDLIIATPHARFVTAYARLGLAPDGGASFFLTRKLGRGRAFEALALSQPIAAQDALRLGLVNRLAEPAALEETLADTVAALQTSTPASLAQTKALVAAAAVNPLARHLDAERRAIARLAATAEAQARIKAFLARRAADTSTRS